MKILNLYSGIGGNRKLWSDKHNITSVEYRQDIAEVYKYYFSNDTVIIENAHQYLLDHFKEFDFIWSSPPCQTHSRARFWSSKGNKNVKEKYPDLSLYEEIIFLQYYFNGLWVVENVQSYYKPLIEPTVKLGRHLFWSNFNIPEFKTIDADIHKGNKKTYSELLGFDLSDFKIKSRKDQIYRNTVYPKTGKYILDCALNKYNSNNIQQSKLFK